MRSKVLWLVVIVGLLVQHSHRATAAQDGGFMAYGPTDQSCGTLVALVHEQRQVYDWWILGFVSGAGRMIALERPLEWPF